MRTTVDIDPELVKEAMEAAGVNSRSRVIDDALKEYIRRRRIDEFRSTVRKINTVDNLAELDEMEKAEEKEIGW